MAPRHQMVGRAWLKIRVKRRCRRLQRNGGCAGAVAKHETMLVAAAVQHLQNGLAVVVPHTAARHATALFGSVVQDDARVGPVPDIGRLLAASGGLRGALAQLALFVAAIDIWQALGGA